MQMTSEEIVRDYKSAANKSKQIRILADLNAVSPGEIRAVLAEAGVEGVDAPKRIRQRKAESPAPAPEPERQEAPVAAALPLESVYYRIEGILASIPEDASLYVRKTALELMTALFREYLERRIGGTDETD